MYKFAERISTMEKSAEVMRGLFNATVDPNAINFASGSPANVTLPVDEIRELTNEIIRRDGRGVEALQYNSPKGSYDLRKVVADQLLPRRGIKGADPEDVMIVQGGLETLNFACQLFINKGDVILVEKPTFMHAVEIFRMFEAECIGVECDEQGMLMDDLTAKCDEYDVKMIYVIPSFQNPTGNCMGLERRKKMVEIATEKDVMILEDDPYVELRFRGEDLPALKSFDKQGKVIFANSFSKIFSPGVRLGYVYADQEIIYKMFDVKTATNSHTTMLPQILCAEYFKRGYFEEHIKKVREHYRNRQEVAQENLKKYMPEGTEISKPDGGMFAWIRLPAGCMDTTRLLEKAKERSVLFVAGEGFYVEEGMGRDRLRLSFSNLSDEEIERGVRILGELITEGMS